MVLEVSRGGCWVVGRADVLEACWETVVRSRPGEGFAVKRALLLFKLPRNLPGGVSVFGFGPPGDGERAVFFAVEESLQRKEARGR